LAANSDKINNLKTSKANHIKEKKDFSARKRKTPETGL
jgi:hypothetical protein